MSGSAPKGKVVSFQWVEASGQRPAAAIGRDRSPFAFGSAVLTPTGTALYSKLQIGENKRPLPSNAFGQTVCRYAEGVVQCPGDAQNPDVRQAIEAPSRCVA